MKELERLRDRVDALEIAIGIKMPEPYDFAIRRLMRAGAQLPNGPVQVLGMLLKREAVSTEGMSFAIPGSDGEPSSPACLKVYVHRIRAVLTPLGISIESFPGGYRMTPVNKIKLRDHLLKIVGEKDGPPANDNPPSLQALINAGMA